MGNFPCCGRMVSKKKHRKQKNKPYCSQIIQDHYEASHNDPIQQYICNDDQFNNILSKQYISLGTIAQLDQYQQQLLTKWLDTVYIDSQSHQQDQLITIDNLKTRSSLHTHRIKPPHQPHSNQVSCCPYNSYHIIEYHLWSLINSSQQNQFFIYHPFTNKFLNYINGQVVCSNQKMLWQIISFGKRRNQGYIKIYCQFGQLCMTSNRGLLHNHRKLTLCNKKHIQHIWQINFGENLKTINQI